MNNFVMKVQQRGRKRTEEWGVRNGWRVGEAWAHVGLIKYGSL